MATITVDVSDPTAAPSFIYDLSEIPGPLPATVDVYCRVAVPGGVTGPWHGLVFDYNSSPSITLPDISDVTLQPAAGTSGVYEEIPVVQVMLDGVSTSAFSIIECDVKVGGESYDLVADGFGIPDSNGRFSFVPSHIRADDGEEVAIRFRVLARDNDSGSLFESTWDDEISFTWGTQGPPAIASLELLALPDWWDQVYDPTVVGYVDQSSGVVGHWKIEFDYSDFSQNPFDGNPDAVVWADDDGRFVWTPENFQDGYYGVVARTVRTVARNVGGTTEYQEVTSPWYDKDLFPNGSNPLTFDLISHSAPDVETLSPVDSSSPQGTLPITSTPRITGELTGGGDSSGVLIELDYGGMWIADDSDDTGAYGESGTGVWSPVGSGFDGSAKSHAVATSETATASWTFDGLAAGATYEVFATWPNNLTLAAQNAQYKLSSGTAEIVPPLVSQQSAPTGPSFMGVNWHRLGEIVTDGNQLVVMLWNESADGSYVYADAIRVVEKLSTDEIDDADPDPSKFLAPGWETTSNPSCHSKVGDPAAPTTATWSFSGLMPGRRYVVYASWEPDATAAATDAQYRITSGTASYEPATVNQQKAPDDLVDGKEWHLLGTYLLGADSLTVTLSDQADGRVIADAIRVVPAGDGVDGYAVSSPDGDFTTTLAGAVPSAASQVVSARTAFRDEYHQTTSYSDWHTIRFVLEPSTATVATVTDLDLFYPIEDPNDPTKSAKDPTLSGQVTGTESPAYLGVELEITDSGGTPATLTTTTDALGYFTCRPKEVAPDNVSVKARVQQWNPAIESLQWGAWGGDLSFEYHGDAAPAPTIESLILLSDTGSSATDGTTANTTVTGTLADDHFDLAGLVIEFDHDRADAIEEVHAIVSTDSEGRFHYQVPLYAVSQSAETKVGARAKRWDPSTNAWLPGPWVELPFTYESYEDDSSYQAPRIVDLSLLNDTGDDKTDGNTVDPTLGGRAINNDKLDDLVVQLWIRADPQTPGSDPPDETVLTDSHGRFTVRPRGLATVPHTVWATIGEFDEADGAWRESSLEQLLTFTLEAPTFSVEDLALEDWDDSVGGTPHAAEPTLVGTVNSEDDPGSALVELEFIDSASSVPVGGKPENILVAANYAGDFRYTFDNLQAGTYYVCARAVNYDSHGVAYYGDFTSPFTFDVDAEPGVYSIEGIQLQSDQGATDGASGSTVLKVTIAGAGGPGNVNVEFDVNLDGLADGTGTLQPDGSYEFTPQNLTGGYHRIAVRTATDDGGLAEYGDWSLFAFLYWDGTSLSQGDAEALAANLASAEPSWQHLGAPYQGDLDTADDQYWDETAGANKAYDSAIARADAAFTSGVDTIDTAYQEAINAAQEKFVTDRSDAANSLSAALTAYGANGNATTKALPDFTWFDLPNADVLAIPFDGDMPQHGIPSPTYVGPSFVVEDSLTYRKAASLAQEVADQALSKAEDQYRQAVAQANQQYEAGIALLKEREVEAIADADKEYNDDLKAISIDVAWAREAYDAKIAAAEKEYNADVVSENDGRGAAVAKSKYVWGLRDSQFDDDDLRQHKIDVKLLHEVVETEYLQSVGDDGDGGILAARIAREARIHQGEYDLAAATTAADADRQKLEAAAADKRGRAIALAKKNMVVGWDGTSPLMGKAELEELRDHAVAQAAHERDRAKAAARAALEKARAAARVNALGKWKNVLEAQGSVHASWAAYQYKLAILEQAHADRHTDAVQQLAEQTADALLLEAQQNAGVARERAEKTATAEYDKAIAQYDAEMLRLVGDPATSVKGAIDLKMDRELTVARHQQVRRDEYWRVTREQEKIRIEALWECIDAQYKAWRAFFGAAIGPTDSPYGAKPDENDTNGYFTSNVNTSSQKVDAYDIERPLLTSLYDAAIDYNVKTADLIGSFLNHGRAQAGATYEQNRLQAKEDYEVALAAIESQYQQNLALAKHAYDTAIAASTADYETRLAQHREQYTTTVADLLKAYHEAEAEATYARATGSANEYKLFRQNVADQYVAAVAAWDTQTDTPLVQVPAMARRSGKGIHVRPGRGRSHPSGESGQRRAGSRTAAGCRRPSSGYGRSCRDALAGRSKRRGRSQPRHNTRRCVEDLCQHSHPGPAQLRRNGRRRRPTTRSECC